MKVELKNEEKNVVLMEIEIPANEAQKEYDKAVKRVSERANIPGFRKGKAPRNVIESQYGVEAIKYEALDAILPNVISEVVNENKLDVITQPMLESYEFEPEKDLKLKIKVELKPDVTLGEYKNLTLEAEEFKHTDDAFDKALSDFLERQADLKDVTDRAIGEKDVCNINFDGYLNGEKIQGGQASNFTIDMAHSNFIPGFAEGLIGHNLNEEFDLNVTFPTDYHDKKLAGQPAVFKIKINKIQEKVLPELNDEFAKKVGNFDSVDALKDDIKAFLENTKKRENENIIRKTLFEKILETSSVDIQASMIDREAEELLREYKERLKTQGVDYDELMKNQDQEKVLSDIRKDAETRLRSSLVIDKIAKEENIKIDTKDFDAKLAQMQAMFKLDKDAMLNQIKSNPSIISGISQQILSEKVIEFLASNNTVNLK